MLKPLPRLVWIDGVPHRWRRGVLVPIPPQWFARTPFPQNIQARPSKQTHKARRRDKRPFHSTGMYRQDARSRLEARELCEAEE